MNNKNRLCVIFLCRYNFKFFFTLIKETATVPCLMLFFRVLQILWTYWWGRTKTKISASLVASRRSGTATCNQGKKVRTKKVCLSCGQKEKGWSNIQKSNSHLKIYCSYQTYRNQPHILFVSNIQKSINKPHFPGVWCLAGTWHFHAQCWRSPSASCRQSSPRTYTS